MYDILENNVVQENAPGVALWGGTCKCPDGRTYQVGDGADGCATLACVYGEKVNCNKYGGEWSYRKVTCAGKVYITFCNVKWSHNITRTYIDNNQIL